MAKLGDLVVRIGADTRDLNKSLGRVQRNLRGMTSNIKQLGQDMTRSLSLPLAALGAAAVKSAADLETLETSFVSLTGGVEEAGKMMQQLTAFTAKTPFQLRRSSQVGAAADRERHRHRGRQHTAAVPWRHRSHQRQQH